jgi:hypothetical protein
MSLPRGLRPWCLFLACWPAVAAAQVPAGPEFRANTYTTSNQEDPSLAMNGAGNFVVAWTSPQDGSFGGVFAQRYDASGLRLGLEFRVNSYTTGFQYQSAVAMDAAGAFVVVWHTNQYGGGDERLVGQRFDAAGIPRGSEFQVSAFTTSDPDRPAVTAGPGGGFVVSWDERVAFDDMDVFVRRFDGAGAPLGAEFRVNTYTTDFQFGSSVAVSPTGGFIVAWQGPGAGDTLSGIFARRFDASGNPLGAEFRVNTYTTHFQYGASVASDRAGNFVVVWTGGLFDTDIFGQRFDAAGVPRGSEFRVNTYTTQTQDSPSVAVHAEGDFVVSWFNVTEYGDIFAQRFDAAGSRRGAEFRVNTYTTGLQIFPGLAGDAGGNFVVVWRDTQLDGSLENVHGQRFGGLAPAALAVDGPGNAVWEPGELAEVKPSWRNFNGTAQPFGGVLSGITGPAGATYGIADNTASYGTVPDGATAACTDCYVVLVSNPANRPLTHWDATALETITPGVQGQVKRWPLHIGRSFADVTDGSPFYRFVETLLHRGVTGGCGGASYCPSSATTREQMSVFVLVAKEGTGYLPPPCAPPNIFNDVPETSPFCRWVEELSNRGVAGGCGGGNYCPANPVTREQMSVFVLRTLDPTLSPPACVAGSEMFADVPASSAFCRWIEELARRQVVTGCGGGNYCPVAAVTREQMGVFLGVTFGLTPY